ncbi:hypothetical protein [Lacibacter sediminis]|uniref:DUF4177 domain-containing protein n=1 Tax=Lacibacter sediminis TaxID=2760713 RepID=A0A7G5XG26_9BACT|nr:hypothetical protein [Lacibacter sediminis]QNA44429.1 hypothetical protein H4075_20590 [Lacibacter sediminis]
MTLFVMAQQTNTIEQYCTVKIYYSIITEGTTITIDEGNDDDVMHRLGKRLRDSSNNLIRFKSAVDALNYMGKQGWKLVHAVSNSTDNSDYLYLFKREVKKE